MAFDLGSFHRRAVETPSHDDVGAMRDLLVESLADAGVEATVDDLGNVVATRGLDGESADGGNGNGDSPGESDTGDGPHYVLNTHVDTVPPHVPYERDGDVVRGRGACDAKGPLAALVDAFLAVDPGEGRLTLAVTPDEETTQTGAAGLAECLDADGYVVGEPTGLDVCTAARGQFEGTVTVYGESAHAANPADGANAVRAAAPILQALETYDDREARGASDPSSGDDPGDGRGPGEHETLGRPSLTPTMIEGGEATNQVPAECTVTFDRRSVPPERSGEFAADLEDHLAQWLPPSMALSVDLIRPDTPFPEAFATDPDAELVEALATASGGAVRPFGAATEASHFAADAPTVVFGPGVLADDEGAVAHSEREYVRLSEVEAAAEALQTALGRLL